MASITSLGTPAVRDHPVPTPSSVTPLRGPKAQPMAEPFVVNHTLVFTWPNGRERAVIFSQAE